MNSLITVRVDSKTKKAAQKTLGELGLDLSSGVKMFLEQVVETESIPFIAATRQGHKLRHWKLYKKEIEWAKKHGKRYETAEEMFADIFKK
ncbi:MAG: type II toxin-antitoxin system RelB/DinJ family antitoxin [Patescibacteria group bacterium]